MSQGKSKSKKLRCEVCGTEHFVSAEVGMCGPCTTGHADDFDLFADMDEESPEGEEPVPA